MVRCTHQVAPEPGSASQAGPAPGTQGHTRSTARGGVAASCWVSGNNGAVGSLSRSYYQGIVLLMINLLYEFILLYH